MNLNEELKKARKSKGLTQVALARRLVALGRKVTPQQISSWERGHYLPGPRNLMALCRILRLDLESEAGGEATELSPPVPHREIDLPEDFALVEKMKGAVSAGYGLAPDEGVDVRLAFRKDWLEKFGGADQLFVMRVEGDSMEPVLMDNDVVLINRNINRVGPGGGIFAIESNGLVMVKRFQLNLATGRATVKCDNPKYDAFTVDPADIRIEGKVIWYGREMR